MKKLIFGITIFTAGLMGALAIFIFSLFNSWKYNGIEEVLRNKISFIFLLFIIICLLGLGISYKEAYRKE